MNITTALIRKSYLLPCNPHHAAAIISKQCGHRISAQALQRLWAIQCEDFTPIRVLGERPENGFPRETQEQIDRLGFVDVMIEAMPKEEVAA